MNEKKTLECSEIGDQRFCDKFAMVEVFGETKSIYEHFQQSKRFLTESNSLIQLPIKETGGKRPTCFQIGEYILPLRYGTMFYVLLWVKYFQLNPKLVEVLETYDEFIDSTITGTYITGAQVISKYLMNENKGRLLRQEYGQQLKQFCNPLTYVLKDVLPITITTKDLDQGFMGLIVSGEIFS